VCVCADATPLSRSATECNRRGPPSPADRNDISQKREQTRLTRPAALRLRQESRASDLGTTASDLRAIGEDRSQHGVLVRKILDSEQVRVRLQQRRVRPGFPLLRRGRAFLSCECGRTGALKGAARKRLRRTVAGGYSLGGVEWMEWNGCTAEPQTRRTAYL
jgi:hypothetical protein